MEVSPALPDRDDPVAELARERFGVAYLQPYQRLVVANILDAAGSGRDAAGGAEAGRLRQAVLLPTGFGKSLCFQLPALMLPGPTLVVYPLLALMEDQRRRLSSLGIPCALFRGGQDEEERREAEAMVEGGEAKIVITNPECLSQERLRRFLADARPSHVAIDEAHCVSEWGETFRPSYLELGSRIAELDPPALSAFTATAGPAVLEAVAASLFRGESYRIVEGDPDRPNLSYAVEPTLCPERTLLRLVERESKPLLVFCASREGTRMLARLLRGRIRGCDARFYHAGLEREEKTALEEWFFASDDGVLVATCAYGMGVDKKNIRTVLHFGPPRNVEAYLQEAGRAGRDGLPARAVLISPRPLPPPKPELQPRPPPTATETGAASGETARDARYRAFLGYAEGGTGCRREALLGILGAHSAAGTACSGCDRCDGSAREDPEGAREIMAFVKANPRRFDASAAVRLLAGGESEGAPPRCSGWGSMRGWREEEVLAALRAATLSGWAAERRRPPWKGRLQPLARRLGGAAPAAGTGRGRGGRRRGSGFPGLRLSLPPFLRRPVHEADGAKDRNDEYETDRDGDDAPIGDDPERCVEAVGHGSSREDDTTFREDAHALKKEGRGYIMGR